MSATLDDVLTLTDGRRLGYRVRGGRSATPVLYFHGQPGSRMEVDVFQDDILDAAGVQVIAYDRPGIGNSDDSPARDMVDDLPDAIALLDLLGIERVGVIGLSAGGPWAFAFAATYPDRVVRLVPTSASGPYDQDAEAFMHDSDIEEMHEIRTRSGEAMLQGYEAARARMLADIDVELARWFADFPVPEREWATDGPGKAILNADAKILGGVTEFMKVAAYAQAHDIDVAPHGSQDIHVHLVAAIPNG